MNIQGTLQDKLGHPILRVGRGVHLPAHGGEHCTLSTPSMPTAAPGGPAPGPPKGHSGREKGESGVTLPGAASGAGVALAGSCALHQGYRVSRRGAAPAREQLGCGGSAALGPSGAGARVPAAPVQSPRLGSSLSAPGRRSAGDKVRAPHPPSFRGRRPEGGFWIWISKCELFVEA